MNEKLSNQELLKLSFNSAIDSGDVDASLRAITVAITEGLGVPRASIWFLDEKGTGISCADLYQARTAEHSSGVVLLARDFPAYFAYLAEERVLKADDARKDPATFEFEHVYCEPLDIYSLLDAPIRLNGKMVGVVCCEQTEKIREWTQSEVNFIGNITDVVARALQSKERADALKKLELMNSQLEKLVEERTAELEEQRARSANASKMALLGEMASSIAHEINNPLAIIASTTKRLKKISLLEQLDQAAFLEAVKDIDDTTMRIEKIVKGLRFFARDGGKDNFNVVPVSQIMEDTLALCTEKLRTNGCSIELQIEDPKISVRCQPVSISQALLNLISNASDAIANLEQKWIRVGCRIENGKVEVRVTDSGAGIPKEIRDKIMLPFFTTKPIGKGTGLGLGIVRGIIEQHKGELLLDEASAHTSFVLRLPKLT